MQEVTEKSYKSSQVSFNTINPVSVTDAVYQASAMHDMGSSRVLPRKVATGQYRGQQSVGSNRLIIDSSGGRIILNDTQYDRMILGFDQGGF